MEIDQNAGVVYRRLDLSPVANDAGIVKQTQNVRLFKLGHLFGVKVSEDLSERLSLSQNCQPGEA